MLLNELLAENQRRLDTRNAPFDPCTGEGSIGPRVPLDLPDYAIPRQWIPESMARDGFVKQLIAAGSIRKFISLEFGHDPSDAVEYHSNFGMSRDDEVEAIAMDVAIQYERDHGRNPIDVSADNVGYDIRSEASDGTKRYIEVKGRASTGGVMLSENERNRLQQLGTRAWLYIVTNCRTEPSLNIIQDPGNVLSFQEQSRGIQYFLPLDEWQANTS